MLVRPQRHRRSPLAGDSRIPHGDVQFMQSGRLAPMKYFPFWSILTIISAGRIVIAWASLA